MNMFFGSLCRTGSSFFFHEIRKEWAWDNVVNYLVDRQTVLVADLVTL